MLLPSMMGIYCIENWSGRRANRNSVRPLLEFLETSRTARFIHERVSSLDELESRLDDWAPRKQYPLGYLALHGSDGRVKVGRHDFALDDLLLTGADDGSPMDLSGKALFLASCSTLAGDRLSLRRITRETKLNTLCGYGRDVEWFAAAAFDLLVLSALSEYKRPSDGVKHLHREHGSFLRSMRFRAEPDWRPTRLRPTA